MIIYDSIFLYTSQSGLNIEYFVLFFWKFLKHPYIIIWYIFYMSIKMHHIIYQNIPSKGDRVGGYFNLIKVNKNNLFIIKIF